MKYIKKISSIMLVVMITLSMTVPSFAATFNTSATLKEGSSGTQVKYLQYNLNGLGYNAGSADGKFGANTKKAVRQYQTASNLGVDGITGPKTLSSIKSKVTGIQNNLQKLNYYSGSIDGIYGSGTKSAVKNFQSKYKLTANGIADSKTISTLNNAAKKVTANDKTYQVSVKSLYQTGDNSKISYGKNKTTTVANSGCGGVALAMAVNALKNKNTYTGQKVMQWMADNGYYNGNGTVQAGLNKYAVKQGLKAKYADTSSTLINELKKGAVAIAIVKDKSGHQYFANASSSGHYILISGFRTKNGVKQVYVNNPMKTKTSGWFDLTKLEKNLKNENDGYTNSYVIISK